MKTLITILLLGLLNPLHADQQTWREGNIVRADACVLAMPYDTGDASDVSGKGNDGTVLGATYVQPTSTVSGHYSFDGVNDDVSLTGLESVSRDYTFCFWLSSTENGSLSMYLFDAQSGRLIIAWRNNVNKLGFYDAVILVFFII